MADFSPIDVALSSGYYQPTNEAGLWTVAAIGLLVVVTWALRERRF